LRAFEKKEQFVREHVGFAQAGRLGEPDESRPHRRLVFLDHAAGRMSFFRYLDCGIGERATALVAVGDVIGRLPKPRTKGSTQVGGRATQAMTRLVTLLTSATVAASAILGHLKNLEAVSKGKA
jgi:hypothetical protein